MSEITDKIRSRGHWEVTIRPADFVADRVPYADLPEILTHAAVRFRGWPVPFVDHRERFLGDSDWIGQDIEAAMVAHYEAWRLWMSGQFSQLRSVSADWREGEEATRTPSGFSALIEVWEIVFYLTEVFELAARLALGPSGSSVMVVRVSLFGLDGRGLVVGQRNRAEFIEPYMSRSNQQTFEVSRPRDVLISRAREEATEMARDFLLRFGWEPSITQLAEHQAELAPS